MDPSEDPHLSELLTKLAVTLLSETSLKADLERLCRVTCQVRHVSARAAEPSATCDALLPVATSFAGLRDREALVPALHSAAETITDLPTRERVLGLARYTSRELTVKKRGRFGQVVVDVIPPTEPDPAPPGGPVHPKRPPGTGPASRWSR